MVGIKKAFDYFNKENIRFGEVAEGVGCAMANGYIMSAPQFYINPDVQGKERTVDTMYCLLKLTDKWKFSYSIGDYDPVLNYAEKIIEERPLIGERIERIIAEAEKEW